MTKTKKTSVANILNKRVHELVDKAIYKTYFSDKGLEAMTKPKKTSWEKEGEYRLIWNNMVIAIQANDTLKLYGADEQMRTFIRQTIKEERQEAKQEGIEEAIEVAEKMKELSIRVEGQEFIHPVREKALDDVIAILKKKGTK